MRKIITLILIVIAAIGSVFLLIKYIRMDGIAFAWVLNQGFDEFTLSNKKI
jgi:hypothetical protein